MERSKKVLIVEDEQSICRFMSAVLGTNGYEVETAATGEDTLEKCRKILPDVLLLDLGLPDMDGFEVLRKLRERYPFPVVVVSARTGEEDKAEAVRLGADEYVTKPFGTKELLVCVEQAEKRRKTRELLQKTEGEEIRIKELCIDTSKKRVCLKETELELTRQEFQLLKLLAENAGRVLTYDFLTEELWGEKIADRGKELRILMAGLRKKLEKDALDPEYIFAEIGVGYRFCDRM